MSEEFEKAPQQVIPVAAEPASPTPTPAEPPVPSKRPSTAMLVAIALVVGAIGGFGSGIFGAWIMQAEGADDSGAERSIRVVAPETDEPVAAAAAAAVPSVVNIDIAGSSASGMDGLPEDHPSTPARGNGSGVAFRQAPDGGTFVLTNAHVVRGANRIIITGTDRERREATLVGADQETDVAVLRVEGEFPLIELGDSSELEVGQLVVAIGSPFGLTHSVSSGVVSAIGRSITDSVSDRTGVYPLVDVVQTDAAINPGNSGGALVDRLGRLIGINTAIFTDSGANDGIGFAIPVANAVRIADQLIEDGSVEHPFLGIQGRTVHEALAESEGLPVTEGALVVAVTPGTEAEASGVRPDDLIVALNDEPIRSMEDLILHVRRHEVGASVTLHLYRDDRRIQVEMKVGIKPANLPDASESPTEPTE